MSVAASILELCDRFLAFSVTAGEFEVQFYALYKNSTGGDTPIEAELLGELFAWVDAYEPRAELRDPSDFDVDEEQLRGAVSKLADSLRRVVGQR